MTDAGKRLIRIHERIWAALAPDWFALCKIAELGAENANADDQAEARRLLGIATKPELHD